MAEPSLEVRQLTAGDLDVAATLLAARQRRVRAARPELPAAYEATEAHLAALEALFAREGARGYLALRGGEPQGFLLGYPRPEPIWGRACWSPIEGSALADGVDPEVMRDLFAPWSEHFARRGYFRQYVHAAASERELVSAWHRTGFGHMQAHAARDLDMLTQLLPGVTVRRAGPEDLDAMEELLPLISLALMRPPAYAITFPETILTYRESWAEELVEPGARHWVAEENGRILAMATFYDAEPGPMVPEHAWELAVAMTRPEERGRGLMRGIVAAGFAAAKEAGATHCITDWRTASLPTHRTWTSLGFVATHYRMHRHLDERVAWADPAGR